MTLCLSLGCLLIFHDNNIHIIFPSLQRNHFTLVLFYISFFLGEHLIPFAAGEDYSDILAELRVLRFKFQNVGSIAEEHCFNVTILSDLLVESDEVFLVKLSTDEPQVVLSPEEAEVAIINNDRK